MQVNVGGLNLSECLAIYIVVLCLLRCTLWAQVLPEYRLNAYFVIR
jgi:hypothetical protein